MKKSELENLIGNLCKQKPELHDADILTDSIMAEIMKHPRKANPQVLIWIRAISSAAAIFFIALFASQQSNVEIVQPTTNQTTWLDCSINIDSLCIQKASDKHLNLMEIYYCHMQQNSEKNRLLESIYQQLNN